MFFKITVILLLLGLVHLQRRNLRMTIKSVPEFIAAFQERVAPLESAIKSVQTLLATQQAELVKIRAELANNGVPPDQLASLDTFLTTLDGDTAKLAAAAVVQNTGSEGEPEPQPQPEPEPVSVTTTELPDGVIGASYSATIEVAGGTGPYSFLSSPPSDNGLTVNSDGTVIGTPVAGADSSFVITATDSLGATGNATLAVHVPASE